MSRTKNQHHQQHDQKSKVFYYLSSQILNLIRYPPTPFQFSNDISTSSSRRIPLTKITPAGFASLLLGISLSLMLCGSITFIIGFLLMPWVLGLVMLFYVVGIVSGFVVIFRAVFYHTFSPKKGFPGKHFFFISSFYIC